MRTDLCSGHNLRRSVLLVGLEELHRLIHPSTLSALARRPSSGTFRHFAPFVNFHEKERGPWGDKRPVSS